MMNSLLQEELKGVVELYTQVKKIILTVEAQDYDNLALISTYKNFRDSLDHVMRFLSSVLSDEENIEYASGQLARAKDHILWAGFDTLDSFSVDQHQVINKLAKAIASSGLSQFGEYINIYRKSNEMLFKVAEFKRNEVDAEKLIKYADLVFSLSKDVSRLQREAELHLLRKRELKNRRFSNLVIALSSGLTGAILAWLVYTLAF